MTQTIVLYTKLLQQKLNNKVESIFLFLDINSYFFSRLFFSILNCAESSSNTLASKDSRKFTIISPSRARFSGLFKFCDSSSAFVSSIKWLFLLYVVVCWLNVPQFVNSQRIQLKHIYLSPVYTLQQLVHAYMLMSSPHTQHSHTCTYVNKFYTFYKT